ncbi:carotenoid biosynthesis protein [Telluria beijingensis]|uniref:carotenoid biosynthesis protein n=1 Tax=Telluria beijingensis TaxID=3068633 RepID=UPI002795259C|nr:carotenoid biosynthesis protein [Massilia sp. REN29]
MTLTPPVLSRLALGLTALAMLSTPLLLRGWPVQTQLLVASSLLMAGLCLASAAHVLGARPALWLALIALPVGWFAEQMGASDGWFFGSYDYTDVLGPRLGEVPVVIPLMWFALTYTGYVMANLIVWQVPADGATSTRRSVAMAFLAALVVTAYDLGVDPYMVYKLKAWIMVKHDGWWFGETLQGFVGWMLVAFAIVFAFRLALRRTAAGPAPKARLRDVLVPLGLYGGLMVYEATQGVPVETRTIALFVMGIPLFCAACGLFRWRREAA